MKGDCIVCGKEVERSPSLFSKTGKVFCSQECNQAHHFKIRSKITNCIICKVELKPGEGWATPLKKRKDYLCPVCKGFGTIQAQKTKVKKAEEKLSKWHKKYLFSQKTGGGCVICGVSIVHKKNGRMPITCGNKVCINRRQTIKSMETPQGRLNMRMRVAIGKALKGAKLNRKWSALVGYDAAALKKHIEGAFLPGMGWDNYGQWHIDHIIPKSKFNYSGAEDPDFKRCWALSNLQPLWAADNLRKNDKLAAPFQPQLSYAQGKAA
jgi:hypothetical protein